MCKAEMVSMQRSYRGAATNRPVFQGKITRREFVFGASAALSSGKRHVTALVKPLRSPQSDQSLQPSIRLHPLRDHRFPCIPR